MARKGWKSLTDKRNTMKTKGKEDTIESPSTSNRKKGEEDALSKEEVRKLLEQPMVIKTEPLDEVTETIMNFVASGRQIDVPQHLVSVSTPEVNLPISTSRPTIVTLQSVESTAIPVSPREEEDIVSIDDELEESSDEVESLHLKNADEVRTSFTSSPPNELMETSEEADFFKVEGECVIRMAGEDSVLKKADIVPFASNIGFIGCGPMAEAFIAYLIKTGHSVYAYNRTAEKWRDVLVKPTVVSSPAALLEKCNIVFCCVRDSAAVKDIMEKPKGVLDGMDRHPVKAYVEMSSVDPDITFHYSQEVSARGGSYLNAQIWRTRPAAYMGCSIIKASGDRETFEKYQSCFASFSTYVVYLSSNVGEASITSICQHTIESLSLITLSDIMLAADKMESPKESIHIGLDMNYHKSSEMISVAAIIMMEDRPDVFIPLRHVVKNLRLAIKLRKSEMFGNELLLTSLQVCNGVLNQYPEAADHDVSCLYKLRSPPFACHIEEA